MPDKPRPTGLVIERLPDWSFGAFLDNTQASCIALGQTEDEAWKNGMARLIEAYRGQEDRERRIRLEECLWITGHAPGRLPQVVQDHIEALRAPVPAERAGDFLCDSNSCTEYHCGKCRQRFSVCECKQAGVKQG